MNNDIVKYKYTKYKTKYLDIKNMKGGGNKYIVKLHTYDDWIQIVTTNPEKQCEWIYNIIENNTESDRIIYQNEYFILITEPSFDINDIENTFHLLAFPKDKSLKSIRELNQQHIPLLEHMFEKSKSKLKKYYNNINIDEIETHFHYPPNVFLLHMHFELTNSNKKCRKPLREHSVIKVIENLKIDSDYYKKIKIDILEKIN